VVAERERGAALFRGGKFTLADGEASFDGWSNSELWNGWEMPRFGFAVCREILRSLGDEQARFEEKADAFVTISNGEEVKGFNWKHNGLQHSFISYRVAVVKNVA